MAISLDDALTSIIDYGKTNKARNRINELFDDNSFVEKGMFISSQSDFFDDNELYQCDGIITGHGTVNGELVFAYAIDINVAYGSISYANSKKIESIYDEAMKVGAPVVALIDSDGVRIGEGFRSVEGFGKIIRKINLVKHKVITLTAVFSDISGVTSFLVQSSDFSVKINGLDVTLAPKNILNCADKVARFNGTVDLVVKNEKEAINFIKDMISLLPSNKIKKPNLYDNDDSLNRELVNVDMKDISSFILDLFDYENVKELGKYYTDDIYTFLGTIGGILCSVIVTSSDYDYISYDGVKKINDFVNKSNNLNIPIITIVDSKGFDLKDKFERANFSREVSNMINSYLNASVPKITIYAGESVGSAYFALGSKHIGSDVVLAFEDSKIGVINSEVAAKKMYEQEIKDNANNKNFIKKCIKKYEREHMNVFEVAKYGYVDDIIYKKSARKRIIALLDMLHTKGM